MTATVRQENIEFTTTSNQREIVKAAAGKGKKKIADLIDRATNNLLRAVKKEMIEKQGRLEYKKLRAAGYSNRILAKLKKT